MYNVSVIIKTTMKTLLEFDLKKATQALDYLALKEGGKINKMKAIKLIWLADRHHLRNYGRPIINDTYVAMEYGPVGSSTKDLAEQSDFLSSAEKKYVDKYIQPANGKVDIKSVSVVDQDVFSKSDLETLDLIYSKYGKRSQFQLARFSHLYPEWNKFEELFKAKATTRENMTYLDFFKNPEQTPVEDIFSENARELDHSEKIFKENFAIANFWE
jgi:uncharacterized phage-associated protein